MMKIRFKYRGCWWWKIVHYNYFHKKIFKNYYVQKNRLTDKQIRKYQLYIKLDDLITLRKVDWLRIFIWKLEP
jgi:hypothetical protein